MLLYFIIALCLLVSVNGGDQPQMLKIEKVASCCNLIDNDGLYRCIREMSEMDDQISSSKVVLLSSAVPSAGNHAMNSLRNFTQYQLALVAGFAEQSGYFYNSLDDAKDAMHEPEDIRWNKIKLLIDALDPVDGWARNAEYIVWIDADAIILDYSLRFEDIGKEFSTADIIASADLRMGLINTGVLLLRNTAWTRDFLERWWTVADRTVLCDQDAFDVLYKQYLDEEKHTPTKKGQDVGSKVKILAMDRLNSHPPAMLHQQPHNPILHLMGESTAMRTAVFKEATQTMCKAASSSSFKLPNQLGITREYLLQTASVVYKEEVDQRLEECSDASSAGPPEFEKLSLSAHHYCDILEHLVEQSEKGQPSPERWTEVKRLKGEILSLRRQILDLSLENVERRKVAIAARTENQDFISELESVTNYALMLKRAAEAGNDVYRSLEKYDEKKQVAKQVLKICDALSDAVSAESKYVPKHMKALMTQNLGRLEYDRAIVSSNALEQQNGLRAALKALKKSLQYFDEAQELQGISGTARSEHSLSLQMVAGITCDLGDHAKGTELWQNAIDQAEASTNGVELGVHFDALPSVYLNAAICNAEAQLYDRAKQLIDKAISFYTKSASNNSGFGVGSRELRNALKNDDFIRRAESLRTSIHESESKRGRSKMSAASETKAKAQSTPAHTDAASQSVGDDAVEWEECDGFCEIEETNIVDDAVDKNSDVTFTEDDDSIYEGLTRSERQEVKETRERYARTASRFYNKPRGYETIKSVPQNVAPVNVRATKQTGNKAVEWSCSSSNGGAVEFAEDDDSIFDGLNESEVSNLLEVRRRYARVASRYYTNRGCEGRSTANKIVDTSTDSQSQERQSTVINDDSELYEGLSEEDIEEMKERRERYSRQASTSVPSANENDITASAILCDEKHLKRLQYRVKELELEVTAAQQQNKILLEKIALLESFLKS